MVENWQALLNTDNKIWLKFQEAENGGEWSWNEQLSVGNALMDLEHRGLLSMVGALCNVIRNRHVEALEPVFMTLEDWLLNHFNNEAQLAQMANIGFAAHQEAQNYMLRELTYLRDELLAKEGMWSDSAAEHYAFYLKNWMLHEHILKIDMPMKSALQTLPYDVEPRLLCVTDTLAYVQ